MTFQALQATTITPVSQSLTSDYVPSGTDLAEYDRWIKNQNDELGDGLDDISDDLADAGFVPREYN